MTGKSTSSGKGKEKVAGNKRKKENEGVCFPCGKKDHCKQCSCCASTPSSGKGSKKEETAVERIERYFTNGDLACSPCPCCESTPSSVERTVRYFTNGDLVCSPCRAGKHCTRDLCCDGQVENGMTYTENNVIITRNKYWLKRDIEEEEEKKKNNNNGNNKGKEKKFNF